jgi:tetratricopeptide (TPR) repeat protein
VTTTRTPTLGFDLPPEVRAASEWSSSRGLVLPGGERHSDQPAPALRSGDAARSPGLEREVDSLVAAYEHGHRNGANTTRVVQGLLALGDLDAARGYAREGLQRSPDDVALLTSAADVDYRSSDLASAEARLRAALRHAPRDPVVMLDLALVLRQRGGGAESDDLLARAGNGACEPVATRARHELGIR